MLNGTYTEASLDGNCEVQSGRLDLIADQEFRLAIRVVALRGRSGCGEAVIRADSFFPCLTVRLDEPVVYASLESDAYGE